jgi:hypothetical protein
MCTARSGEGGRGEGRCVACDATLTTHDTQSHSKERFVWSMVQRGRAGVDRYGKQEEGQRFGRPISSPRAPAPLVSGTHLLCRGRGEGNLDTGGTRELATFTVTEVLEIIPRMSRRHEKRSASKASSRSWCVLESHERRADQLNTLPNTLTCIARRPGLVLAEGCEFLRCSNVSFRGLNKIEGYSALLVSGLA